MSTMIRLVACLAAVSAASALTPPKLKSLKFAAEKQRGWLKGDEANYVFAQLVHAGVALSCYAGYFSSK